MIPATNVSFDQSSGLIVSSQQCLPATVNASVRRMAIVSHNAKQHISIKEFQRAV
jgi:hypothetical protein